MNNLAWKLFFSAVKFEFRSFQFYRRLQQVLFYTKVFMSCILDFLLYDVTQREINNNNEFNYRLCQLASQFSSNREDDDLFWAKVSLFI